MLERFLKPGGALTALVAGATLITGAPAPAQTDLGDNAALFYWRSFSLFDSDVRDAIGAARAEVGKNTFKTDESLAGVLASVDSYTGPLLRGASIDACDFGIEYDLGPGALVPHLSGMRHGAELLLIDARVKADAGDTDAAVDRVIAALRMCDHMTNDRLLISSLVSIAVFREAREFAFWLDDHTTLPAEQRAAILAAVASLDGDDPFGAFDALVNEQAMIGAWALAQSKADSSEGLLASLASMGDEELDLSAFGDESSAPEWIALYAAAFSKVLEAWRVEDFERAMSAVNGEIQSDAFGPLARLLIPNLSNVRRQVDTVQVALDEAIARFSK